MRLVLASLFLAAVPSLSAAADGDRLIPRNPVGYQWRKATLGEPMPGGGTSVTAIQEFKLSPIWPRLRVLVTERSSKPQLVDQMTDENLLKLIANGESFSVVP